MEKSGKTMRGGGIKRIAALVMSGFIALSGAQLVNSATAQAQEAPYNPIASYTDYNVVSFGDLHIKAESEGAVAVGGNFSFTGSQTIIKKQAPVALVVKGGVDWGRSTGNHQVNPQNSVSGNPLSINLEGSQALDKDSNGANAQVQVVPQGAGYGSDLRIQLNDNGPKADAVAYDAAKYDSLFDKNSAITASERLDQESKNECQAPFTLQKVESQNNLPPGIEPPAYFIQGGSQAWLYLKAGQQNILNLTAEELSQISEFQIKGAPISKDTPLFINVTGKNVNFNLNSFDVAVAPYILWNLPEATQVTQSGDSLRGSLLAPMAKLDKTGGNIDGTVIVDSGDMKGSEQHYAPFEGLFTPCGDEPTPVKPEIATNAGAEGEDHLKVISADGGALVDQVAYSGLVPGKEYTLEGEIHDPQGNATGITAKTTFTPETADGSVEVKFEITAANATKYAGKSLVVYETLKEGKGGEGSAPIAEHHDPNDKAQSFTVEEEKPTPVEPLIGTSAAVQGVDDVKVLPVSGGTVVDTVSYENLEPETEYTLAGELVHVGADNQVIEKTGITGSGEFKTAAAADGESVVSGSAEVAFEISAEAAAKYAGEKLVVFEKLSLDGEVVVTHEDPADVKQSFTVEEEKPTPVEPLIGTSAAVQGVDDVKVLPVSGGTVVDTVSYENLEPETEYTLAGELVHVGADNQVIEKTGITGSGEFKTAAAADGESVVSGSAEVAFEISAEAAAKYAGEKLVVFEKLSLDGEVVVTHEDPADVSQSFTVENKPPTTDVIVEKAVTGPKAGEINTDESAEFEITASWFDKDGVEQFKIFKVKPGQEVSVDGLPISTEITLTESGASTKVKNVKWADIIWSGAGVTDGTGASKSATITLDGKEKQKIDLENKTSANGLIIIPIPLPGLPNVPGSSTPPGPNVPVTPGQPTEPGKPGQPTEPSKPGQPTEPAKPTQPGKTGQPASNGSKGSGLANTGANVILLAGGAMLLLLGGAWLVLRARKQES